MRTKIQHKLGGLLLAAGALLLVLPVASASATDYEGDVETTTIVNLNITTVINVFVNVESDAAAAGEDGLALKTAGVNTAAGTQPTGEVTIQLDGETRTVETLEGGETSAELSMEGLSAGEHTVTAIYSGDANYDGSTGSATFTIGEDGSVSGGEEVVTGTAGDDGVLPGVGGVDAWLIGAGALLVLGGGALLLVRRRTGLA